MALLSKNDKGEIMKKVAKKAMKKVKKPVKKVVAKKPAKKVIKKTTKPKAVKPAAEIAEIKVLDRIDAELAKKPTAAVNRKGAVVIEAHQDADSSKPGRSVIMTGDGPKVVDDNGEID